MKRKDFDEGARLLMRKSSAFYDAPFEATVVEVAEKAVKLRYTSGSEIWHRFEQYADEGVFHWVLVEALPPSCNTPADTPGEE